MKTILNAVFTIAVEMELLLVNPLLNARTNVKFFTVQKKDGSRLYLENEVEMLRNYLYQLGTMEAYTILKDFQIGTHVGEVVVLTKEDMSDDEVYIHRSEIVNLVSVPFH